MRIDWRDLRSRYPLLDILWRLTKHKGAQVGGIVFILLVLMAVFAPQIAPYDPLEIDPARRMLGPSRDHWFGTDTTGRDMLSRIMYGARVSLTLGIVATSIAMTFGVTLGLIAGFSGGWIDELISRLVEILLAFPGLLLAMIAVFALGPSLFNAMIAVGIQRIPGHTRVTRGAVLSAKQEPYVESARAAGAAEGIIMVRHLLPNVVAPNIVIGTLGTGTAIIVGAGLSFLGLGAQPPTAEWGLMLSMGRGFVGSAPWLSVFPGLAIGVTVLSINMLGDALRDVLDPKVR